MCCMDCAKYTTDARSTCEVVTQLAAPHDHSGRLPQDYLMATSLMTPVMPRRVICRRPVSKDHTFTSLPSESQPWRRQQSELQTLARFESGSTPWTRPRTDRQRQTPDTASCCRTAGNMLPSSDARSSRRPVGAVCNRHRAGWQPGVGQAQWWQRAQRPSQPRCSCDSDLEAPL